MIDPSPGVLIESQGTLGEICPELFRVRLPQILDRYRDRRVRMGVTTTVAANRGVLAGDNFYRPGHPPEFAWRADGPLHAVVRQFRLDFLRHLGPPELACHVHLGLYLDEAGDLAAPLAPPPPAPQPRSADPRVAIGSAPIIYSAPPTTQPPAPTPEPLQPAPLRPAPPSLDELHHGPAEGRGTRSLPGNIYQEWFGFECMPFNNTPDTHFFFPTEKHREALSRLIWAVSERKGFVLISGEIGSGKSTLCRMLLTQLPREVKTAVITQTHLTGDQLVQAIAEDLGLAVDGLSSYELMRNLRDYLIDQLARGAVVVLIIDEAQNLSPEALEQVRMVTNLETEQEKLLQLILMGQPELRDKLRLPELRQLRQRIAVQYHLEPLGRQEARDYILHRLKVANPSEPMEFRPSAIEEVFRYSAGVPRLINTLCDHSLITAFTRQKRRVTPSMVREAARDLDLDPREAGLREFFRLW